MSKPVAVILAIVSWAAVVIMMNFSELVPNASPEEVRPFKAPLWILAIVTTLLAIKTFASAPKK